MPSVFSTFCTVHSRSSNPGVVINFDSPLGGLKGTWKVWGTIFLEEYEIISGLCKKYPVWMASSSEPVQSEAEGR